MRKAPRYKCQNTMDKIFFQLRQFSVEFPEGFTLHFGELAPVNSGWVVGMKDGTQFQGDNGLRQAIEIAEMTTQFIAGFKYDEIEVWDVVFITPDEADATRLGIENGQMTIYEIQTGRLKWLD